MSSPVVTKPSWQQQVRRNKLPLAGLVLTLLALAIFGWWLATRPNQTENRGATAVELTGDTSGKAPAVGQVPPDFTATTLDGKRVRLSELKGKPVWLNFGATWCTACRAEAPDVQAVYDKAKANGTVVLGLYLDEDDATISSYAQRLGLTYPQANDPGTAISSRYRTVGIPTHFFIDSDGVLRQVIVGGVTVDSAVQALAVIGG